MKAYLRSAVLSVIVGSALAACSTDQKHGLCPSANLFANASDLTVFKDMKETDPAGALYEVQMIGVTTNCSFDSDEGTADSSLDLTFRATRMPTGVAVGYSVPYFVAITRDSSTIVSKQLLWAPFSFQPGEAMTTFTASVPSVVVRLDNGKRPYDYSLLTGLQLTQDQLDYNKKMGRFAP